MTSYDLFIGVMILGWVCVCCFFPLREEKHPLDEPLEGREEKDDNTP